MEYKPETEESKKAREEIARLKSLPITERPAEYLSPTDTHDLVVIRHKALEARVQTLEAQITLLNTQLKQILESLTK
jgi:hypothetical protein